MHITSRSSLRWAMGNEVAAVHRKPEVLVHSVENMRQATMGASMDEEMSNKGKVQIRVHMRPSKNNGGNKRNV